MDLRIIFPVLSMLSSGIFDFGMYLLSVFDYFLNSLLKFFLLLNKMECVENRYLDIIKY